MKKGDFILVTLAVIFLVLWLFPKGSGDSVSISVNGELYRSVPLNEDTEILIETEYGKNTVVIKNGEVYITDADCPDKLCEKEKLSGTGRSVVCLPNRVAVRIEGKKQKEEIDVIV